MPHCFLPRDRSDRHLLEYRACYIKELETILAYLDRHPSMAIHPVTPMGEADLRKHLANQTELRSGLVNILEIREGPHRINSRIDELVAAGVPIIFFDCLSDEDLNAICETVFKRTYGDKSLFFVGSQELGYGLTAALRKTDADRVNSYKHCPSIDLKIHRSQSLKGHQRT